jgi:transcription elongation factor Elf1
MVSPSLNVEFTCPLCGGHQLSLPEGYTDSSMATCGSCGTDMAPWGQIKAAAAQQTAQAGKTPFKGLSSVKGSPRSR